MAGAFSCRAMAVAWAAVLGAGCQERVVGSRCRGGKVPCGGDCVDIFNDPLHCGKCNIACDPPSGGGVATCADARCGGSCPAGALCGDPPGACVDLQSATGHCGECGNVCTDAPPGGAPACKGGVCDFTCTATAVEEWTRCAGVDDRCVDLNVDAAHCGACGHACTAPAGGTAKCAQRKCTGDCPSPSLTVCGAGDDGGGACVDLDADEAHCGDCDTACSVVVPELCEDRDCVSALGCKTGPRRGFLDAAAHKLIAACGDPLPYDQTAPADACATGWAECTLAQLNASTGPTPTWLSASPGLAWFDYVDAAETSFSAYGSSLACATTPLGSANLKGTSGCEASGDYPQGYRLAVTAASWEGSHASSDGCVAHADHACAAAGGTVASRNGHVLCCRPCMEAADCPPGFGCPAGLCVGAPGCADGTREGFTDATAYPDIAACAGTFAGWIDEAGADALCASGWHVCRGDDAEVGEITYAQAVSFTGCFAFDSAHDCGTCCATCRGCADNPDGDGCNIDNYDKDADMGGMGSGCGPASSGFSSANEPSCLKDGRVDASLGTWEAGPGCQQHTGVTGVVCCTD